MADIIKEAKNKSLILIFIEKYIYLVPHIIEKEYIFLKTIIPSRKATKMYKIDQEKNNEK